MKRKSPRGIPDFSHRPAPARDAAQSPTSATPARPAARPATPTRAKPKATSAKSGQRGR